jgi:hypothetical protein
VHRRLPAAATPAPGANTGTGAPPTKALFVDSTLLFNDYDGADTYWASYLASAKGVRFTNISDTGLDGLLAAAGWVAQGAVLYGTPNAAGNGGEPDGVRYVALTLCGLEGLLPVTAALRAAHPALAALPIKHDLTSRWNTSAAAYRWALQELMPRVNHSVGWSAGRSHTDDKGRSVWQGGPPEMALLGLDIAVSRRGFMFNLSPNATLAPEEAALFDSVMAGLNGTTPSSKPTVSSFGIGGGQQIGVPENSLPAIYGWSEPESEYTIRVSQGGGYVLCSGAPNLSFWARVAAGSLAGVFGSVARAAAPPPAPLQDKVYVTFQTNEGDTPKIVAGLFGGSWLNPNRGRVPVAWGINL